MSYLRSHSTSKFLTCSLLTILILLTLFSYGTVSNVAVSAAGNSINVPGTYSTIQAAVDAAQPGDTINVAAGNYIESVLVNKSNLQIIGHGVSDTILNGNVTKKGFDIEASGVSVSGFNVTNCETAIYVNNASDCSITDNYVTGSKMGIWLNYCSKSTVQRNIVVNCEHNLRLSYSTNNIMKENNLQGNQSYNFALYGSSIEHYFQTIDTTNKANGKSIYYITNAANMNINSQTCPNLGCLIVVNSTRITVQGLSISNSYDGILFAYVNSSTIQNVESINNKIGVELFRSQDCQVLNSLTEYNMYHGILLSGSSKCLIDGNNVTTNHEGIYLSDASNSTFTRNTIFNNEIGLKMDGSYYNLFFHNNFLNNSQQTNFYNSPANVFDNGQEGNYWSTYQGQDNNSDAIGDTALPCEQVDNYPLMGRYQDFTVTKDGQAYTIETITDGEIISLTFNQANGTLAINATGKGETCFSRIIAPTQVVSNSSSVVVNSLKPVVKSETSNGTHTILYITYKPLHPPSEPSKNESSPSSSTLLADAGPDQMTTPGAVVFFNGNRSYSNTIITGYNWSFGDGGIGSGITTNHTYTESGVYTVTLTVEDAAGNQDSDSLNVTVIGSSVNPNLQSDALNLEAPFWWVIFTIVADSVAIGAVTVILIRSGRKRALLKKQLPVLDA